MSPAKIISDLAALEKTNSTQYDHIYFLDANFFVDHRRALEVARQLNGYRADITFSFSTRVNQLVRGAKALAELVSLGLRAVELGIESGSDAALKRFAKDVSVSDNERAIDLLKAHDLTLYLDFIMFDAETTLNDLLLNLDFLERNGLDTYVPWDHLFSYMTPYLGTAIREHYENNLKLNMTLDDLPSPSACVPPGPVRWIFDEFRLFRPLIPNLTAALQRLERSYSDKSPIERARSLLNAAAIRRLPFVTLRNLLLAVMAGNRPCLSSAIPPFRRDDGSACTLEEVLGHALL